ncbi:MAG: DUF6159 family protein [Thermoplasmata archaeon]|nr:DUF6159 family protein [Thermoplasmata archaeon]
MSGTFSDSWRLTKISFRLIWQDSALLVFPLVAGLAAIGVLLLVAAGTFFLAPWLLIGGNRTTSYEVVGLVLFVAAYFVTTFLTVYATAALVGAATLKLQGRQPSAADGWKIARANLSRLVVWSLIAASVGLLIQLISSRIRGAAGLIIGTIAGATWSIATYFIIPVLIYEPASPWRSLGRSAKLFLNTFGRTVVTNLVLALILGAGIVGAAALGFLGLYVLFSGALALGVVLIVSALGVGIFVVLLGATAEGVLRAALYRYATTGNIDTNLLPAAYKTSARSPLP